MFKIPSYSDIEKKEKEVSEKGSELKFNLFNNKRKEIEESKKLTSTDSKTNTENQPCTSKDSISESSSSTPPLSTTKIITTTNTSSKFASNDIDEDDLLLCNIDLNEVISNKKQKIDDVKAKEQQQQTKPTETFKKPIIPPPQPTTTTNKSSTGSAAGSSNAASGSNALLVNSKQRGNPILKYVRNVPWRYSDTLVPDYSMGRNSCALYLSMKYHLLNNEYIHERLRELGRAYELRVLLVLVDIKETKHCLKELEKICILANLTLILAWSHEEAGRYLETYKAYEHKNADLIQEKTSNSNTNYNNNSDSSFVQNFNDFFCSIKSINKTDASTLLQTFGSIKKISEASKSELSVVPGFGPLKVNRIYDTFRTPFLLDQNKKL